jgi:CubicO group peptidase (beta-lactamase class C family)
MLTAICVARAVQLNKIQFSTFAHELLDFWSSDVNDTVSLVQLHHTLSFLTGFNGASVPCTHEFKVKSASESGTIATCVEQKLYAERSTTFEWPPVGSTYDYNGAHMQIAALMLEKAVGAKFVDVFAQLVTTPLGLATDDVVWELQSSDVYLVFILYCYWLLVFD